MTKIKGYYTMEELAERLDWHYGEVFGLARMMDFRKVGRFYLVSDREVNEIVATFADLGTRLTDIIENE